MSNATDILLDTIIQSPRALKALAEAGLETLGDVAEMSYPALIALPGVGEATVQAILAARTPTEADEEFELTPEPEYEEGPHDIKLDSPYKELRIRMSFADEQRDGKRVRVMPGHWLRFKRGFAAVKRTDWVHQLFPHSRSEQAAWLRAKDVPWRVECIEYLKSLRAYKRGDFVILND